MKNKQKGFTLIELLAVIVILAIIALIATPIILNVIETAKKGAAESSGLGYVDAVEKQVMINQVDTSKTTIQDNTYTVEELDSYSVNIKGDKPSNESWMTIEKGQVTACSLKINDYIVNCDGKSKVTGEKGNTVVTKPSGGVVAILPSGLAKGSAVYFNPETKAVCEESEAVSTTETKTGCMKWYVYKDNGDGTYQLILDHNTTASVRWSTTSTNDTNGDAVNAQLATDTTDWDSSLKARLITADEIAEITGANSNDTIKWSSSKTYGTTIETQSAWFYLDGGKNTNKTSYSEADGWRKQYANSTIKSDYAWLFDRTAGCAAYGCNVADASNSGYWTSTPVVGDTLYAWFVNGDGSLDYSDVASDDYYGVRPVITV